MDLFESLFINISDLYQNIVFGTGERPEGSYIPIGYGILNDDEDEKKHPGSYFDNFKLK